MARTFRPPVISLYVLGDGLQPAGLYALKAAFPIDELLATHDHGTIGVSQGYASATADEQHTYEEYKE